jgi:hypothetical protein
MATIKALVIPELLRWARNRAKVKLEDAAKAAHVTAERLQIWENATGEDGPTLGSIDERGLMAAMVANWNSCPFCIGANGAFAAKTMERRLVDAVVADYRAASISEALKAALSFLEIMTLRPAELSGEHAKAALRAGVSAQARKDAATVATVFNIVTRYASALDFAMPSASEFDRSAAMLLKRGYAS